jgi:spore germination cell wall hydrolase CwlJ-like protein
VLIIVLILIVLYLYFYDFEQTLDTGSELEVYTDQELKNLSELEILTRTLWGEGRGSSEYERGLIGQVILNRVNSSGFRQDIISVCLQPFQFSCWNDPKSNNDNSYKVRKKDIVNLDSYKQSKRIAQKVIDGQYKNEIPEDTYYFVVPNYTKIGVHNNKVIWANAGYSFTQGMEVVKELDHYFLREV